MLNFAEGSLIDIAISIILKISNICLPLINLYV